MTIELKPAMNDVNLVMLTWIIFAGKTGRNHCTFKSTLVAPKAVGESRFPYTGDAKIARKS